MFRWALSLLLVVALTSSATASLHKFTLNSVDSPGFSVIKPDFELADTSPALFPGYYYANPTNTASIQLAPLGELFDLETVGVFDGSVSLTFKSTSGLVWMAFPGVANAVFESPLPDFTSDGIYQRSPGPPGPTQLNATITAVPEPSALGFGGLALGLVGIGRLIRRRMTRAA